MFSKDSPAKFSAKFTEEFLNELFSTCDLALYCDVEEDEKTLKIDLYGGDEELLLEGGGRLLRALQVYISSVLKSRIKEEEPSFGVKVDCGGYLEQYEKDLLDLAYKLKKKALREGRPILMKKPMEPFYRRKVHQLLTEDGRVETRSLGEGLMKPIKIFPETGRS